jgi:hypothetical protein
MIAYGNSGAKDYLSVWNFLVKSLPKAGIGTCQLLEKGYCRETSSIFPSRRDGWSRMFEMLRQP